LNNSVELQYGHLDLGLPSIFISLPQLKQTYIGIEYNKITI